LICSPLIRLRLPEHTLWITFFPPWYCISSLSSKLSTGFLHLKHKGANEVPKLLDAKHLEWNQTSKVSVTKIVPCIWKLKIENYLQSILLLLYPFKNLLTCATLTNFSRKNHSDIAITIVFLFRKMHRRKVGQLSPFAAKNNNQPSQDGFGQSMT